MSFWKRIFGHAEDSDGFYLPDGTTSLTPSPDSTQLAYTVQDRNGTHVEVNGRPLPSYDAVSGITFSADARRLAYAAMQKRRWFVVFGDTTFEPWDDIGKTSPVISPDAKHVVYTACRDNTWFAVLDGQIIGGPYEGFGAGGILFSPDSQRVLYVIKKGNAWLAVVDGREHQSFPTIIQKSHVFLPDSRRIAYIATLRRSTTAHGVLGEDAVVIDDDIQQAWRRDSTSGLMDSVYFSPDSKRYVYGVVENGKSFVVIDGIPQRKYDGIIGGWGGSPLWAKFPDYGKASCKSGTVVFSPDSRHCAYAAMEKSKGTGNAQEALLIYDSTDKRRHQGILNMPVVFSANSNRIAYGAERGTKQGLVVDWQDIDAYDGIPPVAPAFNPSCDAFAYIATKNGQTFLVINAQQWRMQGRPVVGANIVWDDVRNLHILTAKGRNVSVARFRL